MAQDFVVFCAPRTGSYSLTSRLDSVRDVVCYGEIFKRGAIELPSSARKRMSVKDPQARDAAPLDFIRELRALTPRKHVGFKLFPSHLDWAPGALRHLTAPDVRRVVLHRDPIEVYASTLRAQETGVWTLRKGKLHSKVIARLPDGGVPDLAAKVAYSPRSFRDFTAGHQRFMIMAHMLAAMPNTFVISYDQINDPDALDALFAFLGSKGRAADSATEYEKQYKGSVADGFSNWDALQARLAHSAPLMEGPRPSHPGSDPAAGDAAAAPAAASPAGTARRKRATGRTVAQRSYLKRLKSWAKRLRPRASVSASRTSE